MIHSFVVIINQEPFLVEIKGMSYPAALQKVKEMNPNCEIFSNINNI